MPDSLGATESPTRFAWIDHLCDSLKGHERAVLLVAAAFQLLVLVGMIVQRLMPLVTGDVLLVRVEPVDPRDLFRGDYVILSYEFSRYPPEGIDGLPARSGRSYRDHAGRTVYVQLVPEPDGRHYRAGRMSTTAPRSGKFLRGRIAGYDRIDFGIESYYVQEGTGRVYEDAVLRGRLSAEIAVTDSGQASLRALHKDETLEYYEELDQ